MGRVWIEIKVTARLLSRSELSKVPAQQCVHRACRSGQLMEPVPLQSQRAGDRADEQREIIRIEIFRLLHIERAEQQASRPLWQQRRRLRQDRSQRDERGRKKQQARVIAQLSGAWRQI